MCGAGERRSRCSKQAPYKACGRRRRSHAPCGGDSLSGGRGPGAPRGCRRCQHPGLEQHLYRKGLAVLIEATHKQLGLHQWPSNRSQRLRSQTALATCSYARLCTWEREICSSFHPLWMAFQYKAGGCSGAEGPRSLPQTSPHAH